MQDAATDSTVITGATGFVGGELLVKLLQDPSRTLICPVRAGSDLEATARGKKRMIELLGSIEATQQAHRVVWIRADIEEAQLGWRFERWRQVAARTIEVFHCAASVSFDLPLDQAHRINVDGTRHVFELAQAAASCHGKFERFHHVSTAFVAGRRSGTVDANFVPTDRARNYRNTYERTKARAERYLRAEATVHTPVSIHRPSIIAGDRGTGRTTNWNVLYVPMKMVVRGRLPALVHGARELVDTIAVDFLVDAMVAFAHRDHQVLEAHHVTAGPTVFTVTDLIETTKRRAAAHGAYQPSPTRLLSRVQWKLLEYAIALGARMPKSMGRVRSTARLARRALEQCQVYFSYCYVDVAFETSREHEVLRSHGVEMPSGSEYLESIIDYALDTNFGRKNPAEAAPSESVQAVAA